MVKFLDRFGKSIGTYDIEVNKVKIPVKIEIGDVRDFMISLQGANENDPKINDQIDFAQKLIIQGNPDEDVEGVKLFVEINFKDVITEINKLLGNKRESNDRLTELKN